MALAAKKARSKRKSRTEDISSASSSDNESVASPPPKAIVKKAKPETSSTTTSDSEDEDAPLKQAISAKPAVSAQQTFQDFYLRQATKEFANDLEKLRNASDFNARSVPVLVNALRQGEACLSGDEKVRVGAQATSS